MKYLKYETVQADPNGQGALLPTFQLYFAAEFTA